MRARSAAGLMVLMGAAALAGHLLGGHAVAATPVPPKPTSTTALPPPVSAGQSQGTHVLWLSVNGRWRAVPP